MVLYCCVNNCRNRAKKSSLLHPGRIKPTFYPFPRKYPTVFQMWADRVGPYLRGHNAKERLKVKRYFRVCSDHFLDTDYLQATGLTPNHRQLKLLAVPSVFDGCLPTKCQADGSEDLSSSKPKHSGVLVHCCALGCPGKSRQNREDKRSFHHFPYSRPELVKKWLAAVGRKGFELGTKRNHHLCSFHFTPDSFYDVPADNPFQMLRKDAVPTVFRLPPPELLDQVDPSAPYLQPRVLLHRVDEPDDPRVSFLPPRRRAMEPAATLDHNYQRLEVDSGGEVSRMTLIIEALKSEIMSTSHRLRSLKVNVSALRHQYQLEKEMLDTDFQDR